MMSDGQRETLHLALYNNMYTVYVKQRVAQQQSNRFMPGELLTSGYSEIDSMTMEQRARMYIPLISPSAELPSIYRLHVTGAAYTFEDEFVLRRAQETLNKYLTAAVDYLRETAKHDAVLLESLTKLTDLNDALLGRLQRLGHQVETKSMASMFSELIGNDSATVSTVKSSNLSDVVRGIKYRRGYHGV